MVPLRPYIVYKFHIQNIDSQVKWWTVSIEHYIIKILDMGAAVSYIILYYLKCNR